MPAIPKGWSIEHRVTYGGRERWRATSSEQTGPWRKSERSAVADASKDGAW